MVTIAFKGRGGGQGVRVLAFYSEFESRWSLQFLFCKLYEKDENKQKRSGMAHFKETFLLAVPSAARLWKFFWRFN